MKTKNFLVLFLGLSWLLATSLPDFAQTAPAPHQTLPPVALHIDKATLNTEIAVTPDELERGLMFREKLADNDGMIFILGSPQAATFWMKNTLIPLSVAFIDHNGVILEIHDMKALDETITRSESNQVCYALETNLHWFALNGIKPGDKILPPPSTLVPTATH